MFSVVTIVGSALWCAVLTYLGAKAYHAQPDLISNPEGMVHLIKAQSHWIVLFVALAGDSIFAGSAALGQTNFGLVARCLSRTVYKFDTLVSLPFR